MHTLISICKYILWLSLGGIQVMHADAVKCKCGRPSDSVVSMRIVGGRRADPHSFPWTVAIIQNARMHCGGAVLTTRHVLSAGHCFKWDNFRLMHVLIGLDNLDDLSKVAQRNISTVIIHESFTSTAVRDENDIAIASLNQPVEFSETITPICLPKPAQEFYGRVGTIVGWGRMGVEKSSSKVLLKASLRILTDEDCKKSKLAEHLKSTMMCAFSRGRDGCQGDSGGPLLVFEPEGKYVQAGVVSWGIGCADPRYPGVTIRKFKFPSRVCLSPGPTPSADPRICRLMVTNTRHYSRNEKPDSSTGVYTKVSYYIDWIKERSRMGDVCDE